MPKMKTKSGAKKRFRLTASGKVRANSAFMRHMMRNKPKRMKRQARGTMILSESDARIVRKYFLPNG
ncbi:MAG TPA: 50S ribosomal protein L35 [Kiloniellales bacterium]|nr:50S ribosomal protein L35 [Kiloniellales bacterium]